MAPVLLFAGVLLLLLGLAAIGGQEAASAQRLRSHSRRYGLTSVAGGLVLVILGVGMLLLR